MLLALLAVPFASQAQGTAMDVLIGDTATTTSQYTVPVNTYYNYSLSEMIIGADEIGSAMNITSISYYYYTSNAMAQATDVRIYLQHTDKTVFASNSDIEDISPDAVLVYSGALNCTHGWNTFTFTTPFVYDGESNLMVIVHDNATGYDGTAYKFATSSTGTGNYKCLAWYSDSSNPYANGAFNSSATKGYYTYRPVTALHGTQMTITGCRKVKNLVIDETLTTSSSLSLTWTDTLNTNATYTIYNVSDSTVVASGITATPTAGLGYTVTGLDANTAYTFGVMADCGAGDVASMAYVSGRTACAAMALPWTCGFEAEEIRGTAQVDALPWCTERYIDEAATTGVNNPYSYSGATYAHSGSRSLYFAGSTSANYPAQMAIRLPEVDVNTYPMNGNRLSFWARMSTATASKVVYIGTTDLEDGGVIDSVTVTGNTYTKYTIPLTASAANAPYVVVVVPRGTGVVYIDDLTLEQVPACLEVESVAITATTSSSISLQWTPNEDNPADGVTYTVYRLQDGAAVSVASNIPDTSYTVQNLDANTEYTFAVEANCPNGNASLVSVTGRTACGVETMPWSENFDDWTAKSVCWSFLSGAYNGGAGTPTASTSAWTLNSTYGNYITISGKALTMNLYNALRYWAVTPAINITSDNAILSVDAAATAWSAAAPNYDDNDTLAFAITTDNGATYTTLAVLAQAELNSLSGTYTTLYVPVTGYNGQTVRFAIYGGSVSGTSPYDNRMVIDNVTVAEAPSCMPVTGMTVSNITSEGATLTWTGDADGYTVYQIDSAATTVNQTVTTTTATITGLAANTEYTFGIVANCGNDVSTMTTVSFRTSCAAEALPFTEDFSATLANDPCWRAATGVTAAEVFAGTALNPVAIGSNWSYVSSARDGLEAGHYYKNVYGASIKHWMITPDIDLSNATTAQLSFDVALTDYNNAALPDDNGDTNTSQAFMVIVSTDGGNTWSANNATVWQNVDGADYTYASLADTVYQNKVINLNQYVGQTIKIAFYCQSLWTGGDNDLHIDNIAVTEVPCEAPVITVNSNSNRDVNFSWTCPGDSVYIALFDNDGTQVYGQFFGPNNTVFNYSNLPEQYFPFGYVYIGAMTICGAVEDQNYSESVYDYFFVTCDAEEQCPVTFVLNAPTSDGWNGAGAALDIYDTVSGLIVASMGSLGATYTTTYNLCSDRVYSVMVRTDDSTSSVSGLSFQIYGPDSTVYANVTNPTVGVQGYFTHSCTIECDPVTLPYTETFDSASVTRDCWITDGPGTWQFGAYSNTAPTYQGASYAYIRHSSSGNVTKLISPALSVSADATALQLTFAHIQKVWAGDQDQMRVYYRTSATDSWVMAAEYTTDIQTWTVENVTIPANAYQVAFEMTDGYGYGVAVDSVVITEMTASFCFAPSGLNVTLTPGNGTVAELAWTAGDDETAWQICLNGDTTTLIDVTTNPYTLTGLTPEVPLTAMVRAYCSATSQSTWSNTVNFTPTNAYSITVADGATTNSYVPIYGLWVDDITKSQFIIPAASLQSIQYGNISKLTFYSSNPNVNWGAAEFSVYVTETNETTLSALADYSTMNQVYAGSLSINNNMMEVTFTTPYQYLGENLMIGFLQTVSGTYSGCSWYGVSADGASMGGYGSSISQRNFLPKTRIDYTPGVAPACATPTGVTVAYNGGTTATVSWNSSANSFNVDVNGTVTTNVTNPYTLTGLSLATDYTVKVQANCGSDTSEWTNPVTFHTDNCMPTDQCQITIYAQDSYGDGWTPSYITISQNGVDVATYSMASQSVSNTVIYDTAVITVCSGMPISFSWTSASSWDNEASFAIANANGDTVISTSAAGLSGEFLTLASCTAMPCMPVTGLTVDAATLTSVTISWTGNAASYNVYNDTALVANVTTNSYTFTGLTAAAVYTFGVQAVCSATEMSGVVTINASTGCGVINVFPYTEDFTSMPACWSTIDADGDGYNWENLQGAMHSASYDNNFGVLYPDNWLITPQFQLTAGVNYEVTWNANPQDTSWPAEHYGLYVSTTTADTTAFTLIQDWTLTSAGHVPVIDLSSYAGQTIYLAFRHWNCSDMFRIAIDNFQLRQQASANQITVTLTQNNPMYGSVAGGGVYTIGDSVTVTATAASGYQFESWVDAANVVVSTANPYTFVAATNVTLEAIFGTGSTPQNPDSMLVNVAVNDATMGTTIPAPGAHYFYEGDSAHVYAVANTGYHLEGWTINVVSSGLTLIDTTVNYPVTDVFELFGGWEVEAGNGDYIWTVTANFAAGVMHDSVIVTTSVNDSTMGTVVPAPGTHYYVDGDVFNFSILPNAGYEVLAVTITESYMGQTETVTLTDTADIAELIDEFDGIDIDEDMYGLELSIHVIFAPVGSSMHTVTLMTNDATMGTVDPAGTTMVADGATFTATATALTGNHFVGWYDATGTVVSTNATYVFTVTDDVILMAVFEANGGETYYEVTVSYDQSRGRVDGAGSYVAGSNVSLQAYAFENYEFVAWLDENGDTLSTNTAYAIANLQSNRALTALFQPKTGIADVDMENVKIYSTDNVIVVRGAEGKSVVLFDVNGRMLSREASAAEHVEFRVSNSGVYLVKVANAAAKRVVVIR